MIYYVFPTELQARLVSKKIIDNCFSFTLTYMVPALGDEILSFDPVGLHSQNSRTKRFDGPVTAFWDQPKRRKDGLWVIRKPIPSKLGTPPFAIPMEVAIAGVSALEEEFNIEWFED